MAGEVLVGIDLSKPVGQRLPPEMVTEIEEVAPSTVNDGSITELKFATGAVSTRALAAGAVESPNIGAGEVKNANLGTNSVTTTKIQDNAITPAKAGPGVMTVFDASGNPLAAKLVVMSYAAYGAITPDPTTLYFLTP